MPKKKEKPNPWLTYAKEIQSLGDQFPFQWNGGGGNWEALKKWLFDLASDRLTDAEKVEAIAEAILNYDKFTPNVHLKIRGYLMRGGLRQFLSEQHDFYNNLLNPTHKVPVCLDDNTTYTKKAKTLQQPQTEAPFKTGIMNYKGFTYWVEGTPPNNYRWMIERDGQPVDNSITPIEKVTEANQAVRLRIDELVNTPTPEPTPKRRGRPRKQVEEPTYTFDAKEDSELVKVEEVAEDW